MDTKPTKHRRVRTVRWHIGHYASFDEEVNTLLADGWYLVKRYTVPSYHAGEKTWLVAELQRYDDYDE